MTATMTSNGQTRKTLASQLDRLDGILDGLDAALAGAVQEAVGLAVKGAVQAVLTEVLTNRDLQEPLRQAASAATAQDQASAPPSTSHRLWQATTEGVRRTVQKVQQVGRRVGLALVAAGSVTAGVNYAAHRRLASTAAIVYRTANVCSVGPSRP